MVSWLLFSISLFAQAASHFLFGSLPSVSSSLSSLSGIYSQSSLKDTPVSKSCEAVNSPGLKSGSVSAMNFTGVIFFQLLLEKIVILCFLDHL